MKLYTHVLGLMLKNDDAFEMSLALTYQHATAQQAEKLEHAFSRIFNKYDVIFNTL